MEMHFHYNLFLFYRNNTVEKIVSCALAGITLAGSLDYQYNKANCGLETVNF